MIPSGNDRSRPPMNCFYHHERTAVGTCKSCQRGLCPECAVDLERGLACRNRCEEEVAGLIQLIQNNVRYSETSVRLLRASRRGGVMGASFAFLLGALFAWFGRRDGIVFLEAAGGCYGLYGIVALIRTLWVTAKTPKA